MISDRPGGPLESNIVLHLNPPSRIGDASWVKPGKTSWSWWSGDYATGVPFQPGMNTETMKHYVDFSAETGLEYILIDEGWSGGEGRHNRDITTTNPNIDLAGIVAHAKAKGVRVWLWAHWTNVDKQADEAFPLFEKWGIGGVKIDFMDRDDQQMVEFYHRAARKAAEHKLLVDFHGAYKPTGLRKYYPNVLTHEGVMGLEYLKWSGRVTAEHNTMIPFTRMLAGPLDYTPGGFVNVTPEEFTPRNLNPATPTTRAHQVGLYVVFETGFQMLADFPGAYKGQKETEFLKAVPVTWDETKVLAGYPGRFIVMARRKGKDWFIGGITNSEPREAAVPLGFLGGGRFRAEIIEDSPDAAKMPKNTASRSETVSASGTLKIRMAPAGGMAAVLRPTR
jgi:alpha-glucosidase